MPTVLCATQTHSAHIHLKMQVHMDQKKTLTNDVHQIASIVWTWIWITHICHPTHFHFFFSSNYIFIFAVAEWCIEPQSATDPSPDLTELEHPAYPTINVPFFPCMPTLHPPLRLMEIVFLWFHFPFLVRYRAFLFQFRWQQDDRQKAGKQLRNN